MSIPFTNGSLSSRTQTLEAITVCTEILADPQRVGDVLQILHRTQQRVPGSRVHRPCKNKNVGQSRDYP